MLVKNHSARLNNIYDFVVRSSPDLCITGNKYVIYNLRVLKHPSKQVTGNKNKLGKLPIATRVIILSK